MQMLLRTGLGVGYVNTFIDSIMKEQTSFHVHDI